MTFDFHRADQGIILANSHRGYSSQYPENTMPAFVGALNAGTHCIEIDIRLTADNQLVVIHDDRIDRVSTGTGYVELMTYSQLQRYDFGIKFHPNFAGTPIPLLSDVLLWAIHHDVGLIVEIKQRRRTEDLIYHLVTLLNSIPEAISYIQLLGFNHVLINQVKKQIPELALQVVTLERYNDQLAAVKGSNASCVCIEYEYTHIDDLVRYKEAGLGVRLYLHECKNGIFPLENYLLKFGHDCRSEIINWLQYGLIDIISHDDIPYLQSIIEDAGLRWE
ncbi:glycerophosphodiester phosphodiesterase [Proteus myxofaciens]|uniref:Glycerophosphoryl diester phosphodiesterase n=1 Tax=Proteus myxofaciens ATCC 19692 TaxID=1354337 RepID=A0A198F9N3_9GAMM|nr:glycerophosphodiester phosphodiesterase family protein [Proteus myxofaciens]OAT21582.1 glycerophosphoryl diester phosphodiesterase [Proteus myxofaciens ATCC 19692]